jgi:hypothetical protein
VVTHSNGVNHSEGMDRFFTAFSTLVPKWTGSHWTSRSSAVLVVVSLLTIGGGGHQHRDLHRDPADSVRPSEHPEPRLRQLHLD